MRRIEIGSILSPGNDECNNHGHLRGIESHIFIDCDSKLVGVPGESPGTRT